VTRRAGDVELMVGRLLARVGYSVIRAGFAGDGFASTPDLVAFHPNREDVYLIEVKSRARYTKSCARVKKTELEQRERLLELWSAEIPTARHVRYACYYRDIDALLWMHPAYLDSNGAGTFYFAPEDGGDKEQAPPGVYGERVGYFDGQHKDISYDDETVA